MSAPEGRSDAPSLRLTAGGTPTAAQLASLVVALQPVAASSGDGGDERRREPAWARAARLEAVGARSPVSADDIAAWSLRGPLP